jgi:hypothetical protein
MNDSGDEKFLQTVWKRPVAARPAAISIRLDVLNEFLPAGPTQMHAAASNKAKSRASHLRQVQRLQAADRARYHLVRVQYRAEPLIR